MADYLTDAFIRLRQRLKRVSGRILPDADGAEDILQDSFVRLWRRQYPLQSEKEAEALLTRTVRNASLNERRRARSVPLERDYADDSPDTQEKERAFAQMKEKIQAELTDTQRYILDYFEAKRQGLQARPAASAAEPSPEGRVWEGITCEE